MLLFLLAGSVVACDDDDDDPPRIVETTYNYTVALSGDKEVPPNASTATGQFVGSYKKSNRQLSFTLTYNGISPIDWHIHKGTPDVSGPVEIGLGPIVQSPLTDTLTLTPTQETDLLNGVFYVNIHSVGFPAGEIRGQLGSPQVVETDEDGNVY